LEKSLNMGNKRKDLFYILGLVNLYTGNYKEATKIFIEALKYGESELTLLAIGNAFYKDNDFENAKNYIRKVISVSINPKIKEKSYFLMGDILFNEKKYIESKKYFDKVININENNSYAYFYRGEIYYIQNNLIKARAEWRKTLEIDPGHIKALKRIY
ncbi:MAG: tetratricopeptide repeat protein, partial [Spirochaetes bacterium]|nr:tetratricopeptide repeat protein [Spirochaetota bacterium]